MRYVDESRQGVVRKYLESHFYADGAWTVSSDTSQDKKTNSEAIVLEYDEARTVAIVYANSNRTRSVSQKVFAKNELEVAKLWAELMVANTRGL